MEKSINEVLKAFAATPIEAENVYREKAHNWSSEGTKLFWRKAMGAHPNNDLKKTAYRLLKFLHKNALIEYDYILKGFYTLYEDHDYACDSGLKSYTFACIAQSYNWWLDEMEGDEAEELRKLVKGAETVWYWHQLLTYCVECADSEYGFVKGVVDEAKY